MAGGIVTHNCRCTIENIPLGSPVEDEPTYENWLTEQPEETQVEILGGTAFKLWKDGKLKLREFVSDSDPTKALTLAELKTFRKSAWDRAFGGDIAAVRARDISLPGASVAQMDGEYQMWRETGPTRNSVRYVQQRRNGGPVLPEVVEPETFDQLPGPVVYRGVQNKDMVAKNIGPADFIGDGMNGEGVYTTSKTYEALSYGDPGEGGWTYAMKIDPRAKIIEASEAERLFNEAYDKNDMLTLDRNAVAALNGADAIHYTGTGDDHWIILNKKVLAVDKWSLPENAQNLLTRETDAAGEKLVARLAAIEAEKVALLDQIQKVRDQFRGAELTEANMAAHAALYDPLAQRYADAEKRAQDTRGLLERKQYGDKWKIDAAFRARYEK